MPPPSALACASGIDLAARPALKEIAGDAIARLRRGCTPGSDLDHFAGAIRQRNDVLAHRHAITAAHDAEIAEIKRAGFDLDQNLAMAGLGIGTLDLDHRFDAGAALGDLIGSHGFPRSVGAGLPAPSAVSVIVFGPLRSRPTGPSRPAVGRTAEILPPRTPLIVRPLPIGSAQLPTLVDHAAGRSCASH